MALCSRRIHVISKHLAPSTEATRVPGAASPPHPWSWLRILKRTRLARTLTPSTAGIGGVTTQHFVAMNALALVVSRSSSGGAKVLETLGQYSASSRICWASSAGKKCSRCRRTAITSSGVKTSAMSRSRRRGEVVSTTQRH